MRPTGAYQKQDVDEVEECVKDRDEPEKKERRMSVVGIGYEEFGKHAVGYDTKQRDATADGSNEPEPGVD